MKETTVPLENADSSLVEWIRRARREQTTFVMLDASQPVARLVPTEEPRCTGARLASVLAGHELSGNEAKRWAEELKASRERLSSPEDRWQ